MYETHFGLTKRPFRARAEGSDVFVGPQTAATMSGLKKALTTPDAIVTVHGPVGVGKTTIVRRALSAIGEKQLIVTIGRVQLGHDEMLELLLEEMGAEMPGGTVQRFTLLRRLLKRYADEGTRVFFVVEDVSRIGADALSELEALTAADAGVSDGANVVLMGDETIDETLNAPRLKRLTQRLRLKQAIQPLSAGELMGYLKHCFRLAGKEFDEVFEQGSSEVLHRLSGGIPRMANNLVESSMSSAMDNKLQQVNVAQIKLVASEEYGLDIADVLPVKETAAANDVMAAVPEPKPAPAPVAAVEPESPSKVAAVEDPAPAAEAAPADDDDDIPELIQDTLPDLEVLAPALAATPLPDEAPPAVEATQESAATPKISPEPPAAAPEIPELTLDAPVNSPEPEAQQTPTADPADLAAAQVESAPDEVPEWDRDPTLAELRPDLDALEHAMAVAQGLAKDPDEEAAPPAAAQEPAEPMPEITLDREIEAKINEATDELKKIEEEHAAAEEEPEEDDRTIGEILAEAEAREAEQHDDNSIESQLDSAFAAGHEATSPELPILQIPADDPAPEPAELPSADAPDLAVTVDALPSSPPVEPAAPEPEPPAPVEAAMEPEVTAPAEPTLAPEAAAPPPPAPAVETPAPPEPVLELEPATPVEPALEIEPVASPEPMAAPEPVTQEDPADPELQRIAADLSRAKTIDDCDDMMAETLFGDEFSAMAAEVAALGPPEMPANDDNPPAAPTPDFSGSAAVNVELGSEPRGMDMSASQRLATVRALNADSTPAQQHAPEPVVLAEEPPQAPPSGETPESIEEQIDSSMTATLKALSMRPPEVEDGDDDEDEKKGGFFSRFRRS